MFAFIARRLVAGLFVVFAASFVVYVLMANAGNPMAFLVEITDVNRRAAVEETIRENLNLDTPVIQRYFLWLQDLVLHGDFGISARTQLPVWDELKFRVPMTLKLVGTATILSIVVGIAVGIVTALRQYSGFDYLVSFFTFVFFSLPVFWAAIILKDIGGINFNDWLRDSAQFSTTFYVIAGILVGVVVYSSAGGRPLRRLAITAVGVAAVEGLLIYISATRWLRNPGFGPVGRRAARDRHRRRRHRRDGRVAQHQGAQRRAHHGGHRCGALVADAGVARRRQRLDGDRPCRGRSRRRRRRRVRMGRVRQGLVGPHFGDRRVSGGDRDLRRPGDAGMGRVLGQSRDSKPPDQDALRQGGPARG